MLTELARQMAAALEADSTGDVLEAAEAIDDLVPECDSGEPPPVRVEIGGPGPLRATEIDLRVVVGAAAGRKEPDTAADTSAIECPAVAVETAALVVPPAAIARRMHEAVIRTSTAGRRTGELLRAAARLTRVPDDADDAERMRLITPGMRRDDPTAAEEYERWLEAASFRAIADRADGRYLASHDPALGGVPPPAYIEHASAERTTALFRRYVLEEQFQDAALLAAGAPPNAAPGLRTAWRESDGVTRVNPYAEAALRSAAPAGIGLRTEPGTEIRREATVALGTTASRTGCIETAAAAALMRPRELFSLLWAAFNEALAAAASVDNPRAADLLEELTRWMIVPDEHVEDDEPVFCEPPALAPAVRQAFTPQARAYENARDRAWRLARRQAADGRLLAQHRDPWNAGEGH